MQERISYICSNNANLRNFSECPWVICQNASKEWKLNFQGILIRNKINVYGVNNGDLRVMAFCQGIKVYLKCMWKFGYL